MAAQITQTAISFPGIDQYQTKYARSAAHLWFRKAESQRAINVQILNVAIRRRTENIAITG